MSRLPKSVLKNGKVIDVRSDIAEMLQQTQGDKSEVIVVPTEGNQKGFFCFVLPL